MIELRHLKKKKKRIRIEEDYEEGNDEGEG